MTPACYNMNLKNIMVTERSQSQKTICDSIHMECLEYANLCKQISSCLGLGGMGSDWYEVAFWSDENVLGFTVVMVSIKMLGRKEESGGEAKLVKQEQGLGFLVTPSSLEAA